MTQSPWLFSKNLESDFSLTRKLDFTSLLHFCISMETGSVRNERHKYFSLDTNTPTNAAFFQQCYKLLPEPLPSVPLPTVLCIVFLTLLLKRNTTCLPVTAHPLHSHAILMSRILISHPTAKQRAATISSTLSRFLTCSLKDTVIVLFSTSERKMNFKHFTL